MPTSPPDADAIRDALDRVLASGEYDLQPRPRSEGGAFDFLDPLLEWLWEPFRDWWGELSGAAPWLDEALSAVAVALLLAVIVQIIRMRKRREKLPSRSDAALEESRPTELHRLAQERGEQGRFVEAARLLLKASVLRLEQAERRVNRPGTTNRELLRRYRRSSLVRPLSTLVDTVDQGWFGERPCTRLDYLDCLSAHDEIAASATSSVASTN